MMKTKIIFTATLAIFILLAEEFVCGQDIRGNKSTIPGPGTPSSGYVTTVDNENNVLGGVSDGDMDWGLFNIDLNHPIEFNIFIEETMVSTAQLNILAYDVDWSSGELDKVYVNGNYVGDLSGLDDTWSTTIMNVNPAFLVPGPGGKNLIRIMVDENNPNGGIWAVEVDWGQLVINGTSGSANFRTVTTNGNYFCPPYGCVTVTSEVDANPSMGVRTEDYLVDPSNNSVAQQNHTFTATSGNEPVTSTLCLPANPVAGTWTVKTIVYDATTNIQQDIRLIPITVSPVCNAAIPTLTEWGLIILGLALIGFGTYFILWRNR